MEKIITYALIGLVVSLVMHFLNKKAKQKVQKNDDGLYQLRMNKLYMYLGIGSICILVIVGIILLYLNEKGLLPVWLIFFLIFGGCGIPCLLFYINHKIVFNDQVIKARNWLGKEVEIEWNDITNIKFKPILGYLRVESNSKKLDIHMHVIGLQSFLDSMENLTKWKIDQLKMPSSK